MLWVKRRRKICHYGGKPKSNEKRLNSCVFLYHLTQRWNLKFFIYKIFYTFTKGYYVQLWSNATSSCHTSASNMKKPSSCLDKNKRLNRKKKFKRSFWCLILSSTLFASIEKNKWFFFLWSFMTRSQYL